jgi:hypothetical protein
MAMLEAIRPPCWGAPGKRNNSWTVGTKKLVQFYVGACIRKMDVRVLVLISYLQDLGTPSVLYLFHGLIYVGISTTTSVTIVVGS